MKHVQDLFLPVGFAVASLLSGGINGGWHGTFWAFTGVMSGVVIGVWSCERKVR